MQCALFVAGNKCLEAPESQMSFKLVHMELKQRTTWQSFGAQTADLVKSLQKFKAVCQDSAAIETQVFKKGLLMNFFFV